MYVSTLLSTTAGIDSAYKTMCQPVLEEFHLQQVSFDILMCLANHPDAYTAAQISTLRHLKPSVVSHYVDCLVHRGLLRRETVDGDRRKVRLRLTEDAADMIRRGRAMQTAFYRAMTQGLTSDELTTFRHCVEVACRNADAIRAGAVHDPYDPKEAEPC